MEFSHSISCPNGYTADENLMSPVTNNRTQSQLVIPAEAGIQGWLFPAPTWIPVCAGMTDPARRSSRERVIRHFHKSLAHPRNLFRSTALIIVSVFEFS